MRAGPWILVIAVFAVLVSCNERNPLYCENAIHQQCGLDAGACISNRDCLAPLGVCDLASTNMCVQCTTAEHDACAGTTPACIDHTCQKCTAHSDCTESNVCLLDGSCADAAQVAYVGGSGAGSSCTKPQPCGSLADALATNRPLVTIRAGLITLAGTTTIRRAVTIFATPGATVFGDGRGDLIAIDTAAEVRIYDLAISFAGTAAISVAPGSNVVLTRIKISSSSEVGIASSGATLTIAQSRISSNHDLGIVVSGGRLDLTQSTIASNLGGGIFIKGADFNIANNVIAGNGSILAAAGGVNVGDIMTAGAHTLAFNTIADNKYKAGFAAINCASVLVPLVFSNNIVYDNTAPQVAGANCAFTYSDIGPAGPLDAGNIDLAPMFVNPPADYHLGPTSPAREAAEPAAMLDVDFDGDPRPQGNRRDMGADEVTP
jgi:hypothetical protein